MLVSADRDQQRSARAELGGDGEITGRPRERLDSPRNRCLRVSKVA